MNPDDQVPLYTGPADHDYDVAIRNFGRRRDVLLEHIARELGFYRFLEWLNRRLSKR